MNEDLSTANGSGRRGRGEIEKHRRLLMKSLHKRLASVLPPQNSKENLPLPVLLDRTLNYVNCLKGRTDELKAKKERLEGVSNIAAADQIEPNVVVHDMGLTFDVNLATGLIKTCMLSEVLRILEEEGAQVVSANYATSKTGMIYTIHCQAFSSRIGIDTSRVLERLKNLLGQ